ncbi:MAG: NRDE family protein [Sterolibacterium sp.]|nr:NRDE family protein [Sterolibacterium sp.]
MCLILLAWQAHPHHPLVVAANRDEFFARPTLPVHFWENAPNILAGRDLAAGGTWMGITRQGRFAALTNFREPRNVRPAAPTRGRLVSDFLGGTMTSPDYLAGLAINAVEYNGFNLLCGTLSDGLWHFSNRNRETGHVLQHLETGIYGLSNHLLDTPWPKVAQGKSDLAKALTALPQEAPLFQLLRDESIHDDSELPRTGVSLDWERTLSAAFVCTPNYGTRSCTVLRVDQQKFVTFDEQTWLPGARSGNRSRYRFKLEAIASSSGGRSLPQRIQRPPT